MNKMAVFVEGFTELLFVDKLIQEIANKNSVLIEKRSLRGGTSVPRTSSLIEAVDTRTSQRHYVLIYDCGADNAVKTRMLEEYEGLSTRAGYSSIVCIRDVFPLAHADIKKLEMGLPKFVPTKPVVVEFILSIMEIEAWFLAEHTHFARVDPTITCDAIAVSLGFDPRTDDLMLRPNPAADLHACHQLGGKSYKKAHSRQIDSLDFAEIYMSVSDRFPYLDQLCATITKFLSSQ